MSKKNKLSPADFAIKTADEYLEKKMYDEAFNHYKIAISYDTNNYIGYLKMAKCFEEVENYEMALKCYEESLRLAPEHLEIHKNIADICYLKLKEYEKAIEHYEIYAKILKPSKLLGHIYNILGKLYEATKKDIYLQIEFFEKAYELLPDSRTVIKNLTVVYPMVGRLDEALALYPKLFDEQLSNEERVYYGILQIRAKNFEEGWKYYEERLDYYNDKIKYPDFNEPKWNGEIIAGKTLLVHFEQGFGDTIMFCRYIEQLKLYASKIIFRVQNEMYDLMKLNFPDIEVVPFSFPLSAIDFDYHVPIMSLIHYLKSTVDDIPSTDGYIKADENKVQKYKEKFFNNDKLKIGISYNGSIGGNRKRDIPLEYFYPLTRLKNVQVYSFQKGFGSEQLDEKPTDVNIIDLSETFNDFSDTAAAMQNIDLFITSDNSVFNVAAAMGKKCYVLLNKNSEWRWFQDEKHTPWYSSVEIFKKQHETDSWKDLMQKVIDVIQ